MTSVSSPPPPPAHTLTVKNIFYDRLSVSRALKTSVKKRLKSGFLFLFIVPSRFRERIHYIIYALLPKYSRHLTISSAHHIRKQNKKIIIDLNFIHHVCDLLFCRGPKNRDLLLYYNRTTIDDILKTLHLASFRRVDSRTFKIGIVVVRIPTTKLLQTGVMSHGGGDTAAKPWPYQYIFSALFISKGLNVPPPAKNPRHCSRKQCRKQERKRCPR